MHQQKVGWQQPAALFGLAGQLAHVTRSPDRDIGEVGDKLDGFLGYIEGDNDRAGVTQRNEFPRSLGGNRKTAMPREAIADCRELEFGKQIRLF